MESQADCEDKVSVFVVCCLLCQLPISIIFLCACLPFDFQRLGDGSSSGASTTGEHFPKSKDQSSYDFVLGGHVKHLKFDVNILYFLF